MFFAETVSIPPPPGWKPVHARSSPLTAGTFSVAYALRFTVDVFFGPSINCPINSARAATLACAQVMLRYLPAGGIFPAQVVGSILSPQRLASG